MRYLIQSQATTIQELKDQITNLEVYQRSPNLLIDGVPEIPDDSFKKIVVDLFAGKLGVQFVETSICHRLGPQKPNHVRTIIVQFLKKEDRQRVWDNRGKLDP